MTPLLQPFRDTNKLTRLTQQIDGLPSPPHSLLRLPLPILSFLPPPPLPLSVGVACAVERITKGQQIVDTHTWKGK
jgi:hypothetical protein